MLMPKDTGVFIYYESYHNAIIIIETRNLHTVPRIPAACQKGITWNPQSYRLFRFGFIL